MIYKDHSLLFTYIVYNVYVCTMLHQYLHNVSMTLIGSKHESSVTIL